MGAVLKLPYAWMHDWQKDLQQLRSEGYYLIALTPSPTATLLSKVLTVSSSIHNKRIALMVGHEGKGLNSETMKVADECVQIEMAPNAADSLNVFGCTSVALYSIALAIGLLK